MENIYLLTETDSTDIRSVKLHGVGKLKEVFFCACHSGENCCP